MDLHLQVTRQAVTDELTGLANHGRFQELLGSEMEQVRRYHHPVGLIMLDIDNFKSVNDTYGHQQGDVVLRRVARVVADSSRDADFPARYGGEEMALILPHTDLEGAYAIAERVRTAVESLRIPRNDDAGVLRITASLGVAATTDGAKDALIADADAALYDAKRQGKNRTMRAAGSRQRVPARVSLCVMGLLDDAIREHLDLKRRRGADPTEVDQLEREALGPVRRGTQVQEQTLQEEERFEDVEHESGNAVLYDDQAGEGFADGPALPPEPDFIDEPRESFREPESERSWSHDSDDWDDEEPLEHEQPVAPEQPAAEAPAESSATPARAGRAPRSDAPRRQARRRSSTTSRPSMPSPPRVRTCSRRPPSSSRTRRTTIACGSSSVRRRTSTSTISACLSSEPSPHPG